MSPRSSDRGSRPRRHDDDDKKKRKTHKKRRRHTSDSDSSEAEARAERKARKKSAKMLAGLGYSDETNPFGDSSLSQPFVWGKKYEDKQQPSAKQLKKQQLRRVDDIRKARERREQREAEKEEMERLRSEEMRLKDAEQYEDWQQKEEQFHLQQAKVRSQLRIRANREKPVDLLAKNLLLVSAKNAEEEEDDFFKKEIGRIRVEHRRPHAIVEVLAMEELQQLQEDVHTYEELEESGNEGLNAEFWKLMARVCDDRIRRLERAQSEGRAGRAAIHDSVNETIEEMLDGKDAQGLRTLQSEVRDTIASASSGATGVDVDFWEQVAQQIEVHQARARLTELHEEMLTKLADLMEEHERRSAEEAAARAAEDEVEGVVDEHGRDAGREAREMEKSYARKGLGEEEEQLDASEEVALTDSKGAPRWSEKYQPRKPRYFNRVKTGYDWNKYNQTHYDHDNPPPKVVQGYKFNLFYPDLIDKQTAPRFFLEKSNSDEFCIIRFSAGPPYQDVAFKIVNREWEYSQKRGYKSVFERGILHLYFNFKRHRYRR
ncbi:Cactin [Phytophthora ramorum]|uniref:Cactin n=1 Tax=Phytophthora ramorum TaxID=164328 RepID=UPI0030953A6B|nr:Cactin [Phytophthora ramorum]